jgi:phosphoglycolate phosphatase
MSSTPIKLVIFDLDGTLLDSVPDLAQAADETVKALGYKSVSVDNVRDYVGNGADILIGRCLSQSITVDSNLSSELLTKARSLFDEFYEQTGHKASVLFPMVKETLSALHAQGIRLAIVTNKPSKFVPEILRQHQIAEFFDDVLGGDAFETRKPDPVALNWLMEKYSLTPQEVVMVGDSKNDILAAKNAQCCAFALTYGYNHGEPISDSNPDYVADQIDELLKVVLN